MPTRVGFIGIGNMGWPMAANIAKAGHDVAVYDLAVFDLNQDRVACVAAEHNSRAAAGVGEIAQNDFIITMAGGPG